MNSDLRCGDWVSARVHDDAAGDDICCVGSKALRKSRARKNLQVELTTAFRTAPRKLTGRKTVPRRLFIESEVVDCPTDRLVL